MTSRASHVWKLMGRQRDPRIVHHELQDGIDLSSTVTTDSRWGARLRAPHPHTLVALLCNLVRSKNEDKR